MSTFAVFFNRICEMDFLPKGPAILVSSVRSALPLGSSSMKKLILLSIILIVSVSVSAQDIAGFVSRQMETYPQSCLLDIYKSCFQDYMGAEHLVTDRQRVKAYLDEELNTTTLEDLLPWLYEPCGAEGNYVRVSIRTVKEGIISADHLLDAFIRSANPGNRPSVESWRDRWHEILEVIDTMNLNYPNYSADKLFIDSILSVGKYAISHSPEYREAYHPHYRIVERNIFDREILTLIKKWYARMQMNKESNLPVVNPNALKMPKYDPYRKKFNDMQLIDIFGSHLKR
jgi:hypothetical protein